MSIWSQQVKKNPATGNVPYTNSGDGHVWDRPDGALCRCGGPGFCKDCQSDHDWLITQLPAGVREVVQRATQSASLFRQLNFIGHAEDVETLIAFVLRQEPKSR